MLHTAAVAPSTDRLTARPELALALKVGVVPKFCVPGLLKVMLCAVIGCTALVAADAWLSPALLRASTVKV